MLAYIVGIRRGIISPGHVFEFMCLMYVDIIALSSNSVSRTWNVCTHAAVPSSLCLFLPNSAFEFYDCTTVESTTYSMNVHFSDNHLRWSRLNSNFRVVSCLINHIRKLCLIQRRITISQCIRFVKDRDRYFNIIK